jgi:hypothetical protein
VENEPETLACADLLLLRPRHPVPLPDPLEQAVRQELEAAAGRAGSHHRDPRPALIRGTLGQDRVVSDR